MKSRVNPSKTGNLEILMVAPQPFFRPRGTPFSVLHRIRALTEAGFRVDLVTYPFGEDIQLKGLNIIRAPRPPFVRDVKIGPSLAKAFLDVPLLISTVRALRRKKYDVLHSHEEAAFFCGFLARRHDILHVYDMHSSLPQQLSNFKAYNLAAIRKTFEYMERKVLISCDGIITICAELAEIATRECGNIPHAMIENTADDSRVFPDTEEPVRKNLNLIGKKVILYTGTFEEYQGLDLLLPAMTIVQKEHPDAHLLMVGGTDEQVSIFKAGAMNLGLASSISCVGTVHPSRIPSFVKASDVIVSPRSRGTNTPLKIYGYLRTGKPLVATNMRTHTQLLHQDTAVLVEPNPEGLADGLVKVLSFPEFGQTIAKAAREYAEREFADQSYVSKVISFYNSVILQSEKAARAEPH